MASAWLARDRNTGELVSIKRLALGQLPDWKRLELFEREARVLAQLSHPRIPRLIGYRRQDGPHGPEAWLISEWIAGESLAEKLAAGWAPGEPVLLRLAEQALWILDYLHRFQPPVVHRDLKPGNLILDPDGVLWLIDFGGVQELLQPVGGGGSTVIGTYGYMAPEQYAGRAVPASDLYGLGATLITLLSGRTPAQLPRRGLQIAFQATVQGSGGFLRWLGTMLQPGLEARYPDAPTALAQLYALTGLAPARAPHPSRPLSPGRNLTLAQDAALVSQPVAAMARAAHGPGEQIGNYRVEAVLAQGSETVTYAARQPDSEREVVIKALSMASLQHWKSLSLFEREIETLKALAHPAIPAFIEAFRRDQIFYLVVARVEGRNLAQLLSQGWRPTESEVIDIARQALGILDYLHRRRPPVIHRDLKPSNLMLDAAGRLHLIDFGGVQQRAGGSGGSTLIGTYGYLAPEAFLRGAVPASDLYSLGATLLRLLSGREPSELPVRNLRLDFRELVKCPAGLKDWIESLTEPDPVRRPVSAAAARAGLQAALNPPALPPVPVAPARIALRPRVRVLPLPVAGPQASAGIEAVLREHIDQGRVPGWALEHLPDGGLCLRFWTAPWPEAVKARLGRLAARKQLGFASLGPPPTPVTWLRRKTDLHPKLIFLLTGGTIMYFLSGIGAVPAVLMACLTLSFIFGVAFRGLPPAPLRPPRLPCAPPPLRERELRIGFSQGQAVLDFPLTRAQQEPTPLECFELGCEQVDLAARGATPLEAWLLALHHPRYLYPLLLLLHSRAEAEALAEALIAGGARPAQAEQETLLG